ncbi:MAG: hypothetical protein ABEL76_16760 [Bradymonadaceae bacterium]
MVSPPNSDLARGTRAVSVLLAAAVMLAAGCADQIPGSSDADEERFSPGEPLSIPSNINYVEDADGPAIQGPTPIDRLLRAEPTEPRREPIVWYAFSPDSPYPYGDDPGFGRVCDASFGNKIYSELETTDGGGSTSPLSLPVTVRGVVTYHASHYEKVSTCGQDQKYFGSYIIQDKTGAIAVLRDAEIADYTFGDRVEVEVRGLAKSFGSMKVLSTGDVRLIEAADEGEGTVPYTSLAGDPPTAYADAMPCRQTALDVPKNLGNTFRIEGRVCQQPNSRNFNELRLQPGDSCKSNPDIAWSVSMGLDFGRRGLGLEQGDRVRVTGPVWGRPTSFSSCNWSFQMLALSPDQLEVLEP